MLVAYDARLLRNSLDVQRKANATAAASTPSPQTPSPTVTTATATATATTATTTKSKSKTTVGSRLSNGSSPAAERSPFDWSAASSPRLSGGGGGSGSSADHSPTTPVEMYRKVQRNHSVRNNYDEDLKAIRENYAFMLDNLIGGFKSTDWVHVKMIDFAHVFEAEPAASAAGTQPDANYLFGIESAVRLFEEFLRDCR